MPQRYCKGYHINNSLVYYKLNSPNINELILRSLVF
jgi:hypothetical protein